MRQIGEDADDARAGALGDLKSPGGQARLIRERMVGGESVLLEAAIQFGATRQNALEQGRGDGNDLEAGIPHDGDGFVQLLVAEVHHVSAPERAQLGAAHAGRGHGVDGGAEIGREFVGDRGHAQGLAHRSPL